MPRLPGQQHQGLFQPQQQQWAQLQRPQEPVQPIFTTSNHQRAHSNNSQNSPPLITSGNGSPTSPRAYYSRQIRPLYMPAVLRPTEHPSKALHHAPPLQLRKKTKTEVSSRTAASSASAAPLRASADAPQATAANASTEAGTTWTCSLSLLVCRQESTGSRTTNQQCATIRPVARLSATSPVATTADTVATSSATTTALTRSHSTRMRTTTHAEPPCVAVRIATRSSRSGACGRIVRILASPQAPMREAGRGWICPPARSPLARVHLLLRRSLRHRNWQRACPRTGTGVHFEEEEARPREGRRIYHGAFVRPRPNANREPAEPRNHWQ